jgi:hypothetical protein
MGSVHTKMMIFLVAAAGLNTDFTQTASAQANCDSTKKAPCVKCSGNLSTSAEGIESGGSKPFVCENTVSGELYQISTVGTIYPKGDPREGGWGVLALYHYIDSGGSERPQQLARTGFSTNVANGSYYFSFNPEAVRASGSALRGYFHVEGCALPPRKPGRCVIDGGSWKVICLSSKGC